jgi:tight adherence protein C
VTPQLLSMFAMAALAAGLLLIGGSLLFRARMLARHERSLDALLDARSVAASRGSVGFNDAGVDELPAGSLLDKLATLGTRGVASAIGRQLVADEDRQLLDTCGVNDARGQALFFLARLSLGIVLPLIGWILLGGGMWRTLLVVFFGFAIGYMAPKFAMSRYAGTRRRDAANELPLLIDLLRLLQGVGLSIDQSLHLIEHEFRNVLPVLGKELEIAANQYMGGRPREQSLQRFSTVFDNDDLGSIARLIVQVDRYGGAVQEPLKLFSERIREQRRLDLKAEIGKLTVKMTAVMVLTLLPALLIVTGGAGFVAIIHGLAKMGGH